MRSRRAPIVQEIVEQVQLIKRKRLLIAIFISLQLFVADAQTKMLQSRVVVLPRGPLTRIVSPDRKWTLIFECPNDCSQRKLWIEDRKEHKRRAVREFERSLSLSWSPDGHLFFVSDEMGSNETDSYVYDPVTLKVTDLADIVVAADAVAREYLKAGHAYLRATRWINSHELMVSLFGHFDERWPRSLKLRHPSSFSLRYRLDLRGSTKKVSESSLEQE